MKTVLFTNRGGQYNTQGAKAVRKVLTSLDNANNIYPILKDKAQIYGFSVETIRPSRFQKMIRRFTDLFHKKEYLTRRQHASEMLNDYEKILVEKARLHQAEISRKIYPWD